MKNQLLQVTSKYQFWVFVLIAVVVSSLYYPILISLADVWWNDPDYSHGLLVPFISLYFIWEKRAQLKQVSFRSDYRGLLLLLVGLALLTLGNAGAEFFLMRFSLIVTIAALIITLLGMSTLKILLFPITFLFFMIPLPAIIFNAVAFPLQLFAAQTAAYCLQVVNVPVLREGNLIFLATSIMDVTEACSGIRSLMTLSALGTLFAYITQKTHLKRGLMMLSTIPIAILSNAFRVTGTGLLAQFVGEEAAQGFYHTFTGWLVFILAFLMLLVMGFIFSKFPDKKPIQENPVYREPSRQRQAPWVPLVISLLILSLGIWVNTSDNLDGNPIPLKQSLSGLPLQIDQWSGNEHPFEKKTVDVLGVTDYINRLYVAAPKGDSPAKSQSLWLYAGYYASQREGATYHSPKNCLPGSGWEIIELNDLQVSMPSAEGEMMKTINKVIVQKGLDRQLILYWYQDRGRIITSEYWAKIYLIWDSITKGRTDGAMIRVSVPIPRGNSSEEALETGVSYINQVSPLLFEYLPGSDRV